MEQQPQPMPKVVTDAAQGVKAITWGILAVGVFLIVLAVGKEIGGSASADHTRSQLRPGEGVMDRLPATRPQ